MNREEHDDEDGELPTALFCFTSRTDNVSALIAKIRNHEMFHVFTADLESQRYAKELLFGVLLDNSCAKASTGGNMQYKTYCRHIGPL